MSNHTTYSIKSNRFCENNEMAPWHIHPGAKNDEMGCLTQYPCNTTEMSICNRPSCLALSLIPMSSPQHWLDGLVSNRLIWNKWNQQEAFVGMHQSASRQTVASCIEGFTVSMCGENSTDLNIPVRRTVVHKKTSFHKRANPTCPLF